MTKVIRFKYVNMRRFVFLTIEEKRETIKSKYLWHIFFMQI